MDFFDFIGNHVIMQTVIKMNCKEVLLNKQDVYVVGVSGGVDSMSLLDFLYVHDYRIVVCHVNYHYRHDSDEDQRLVEAYCHEREITLHIKEIDASVKHDGNFQMLAREQRYHFYQEIGKQYHTNKVILAHHKDDVIETILMQLNRNNKEGFLGIQEISEVLSMTIYRPLLSTSKHSLYGYCHEHQVPFHEDYTNFEKDFTRDYIRNVVLPEYSNDKKEELLQIAHEHNTRYLQKEAMMQRYYDEYLNEGCIHYQQFNEEQLNRMLYFMLKQHIYPPYISKSLLTEIKKELQSKKPNIELSLPVNSLFIKEYDNMYVLNHKQDAGYCLKFPRLVYDKHEHFYLSSTGHINEGICVKESDFPITIRTFQPSDVIVTSGGTKKVSRLFIDRKIPRLQRKTWPIVERNDGTIILIPHIAKNIGYLYTKPNMFVVKYKDLGSEKNA